MDIVLFSRTPLFKVVLAFSGAGILAFYLILFSAALVNVPASWFGIMYSSLGIYAGVGCFLYLKNQKKHYLFFALVAILFIIVTLHR